MECPKCKQRNIVGLCVKLGFKTTVHGKIQRYQCQVCGHVFLGEQK